MHASENGAIHLWRKATVSEDAVGGIRHERKKEPGLPLSPVEENNSEEGCFR